MPSATPSLPAAGPRAARFERGAPPPWRPPRPFALAAALAWLAAGALVLAILPAAHVGAQLGATLPFWLVGAPLIDLAWLMRRPAARALARHWREMRRRPLQRSGARRLPPAARGVLCVRHARRSSIA